MSKVPLYEILFIKEQKLLRGRLSTEDKVIESISFFKQAYLTN